MKPLLPSLREKKRYIAFEVMSQGTSLAEAKTAILSRMATFLGEYGMAKAGVIFLKDWKGNKGIFRVASPEVDKAKAALALVKEINGKKASVRSLGTSGTLEKLRSKYLNGG